MLPELETRLEKLLRQVLEESEEEEQRIPEYEARASEDEVKALFQTALAILRRLYETRPNLPKPLLFAPNGTITFEWRNAILQIAGDSSCVFTWPEGEMDVKSVSDELIRRIASTDLVSRADISPEIEIILNLRGKTV